MHECLLDWVGFKVNILNKVGSTVPPVSDYGLANKFKLCYLLIFVLIMRLLTNLS